ncbi:PLP-dependent transferase [Candidatus Woesearchaeota archaeon]|jgi:cystathionine beta-lyase/cystathionine gamma-synthase|nr:PLP-dependent transferase [Candidatus Woesearchaeota archaeon]
MDKYNSEWFDQDWLRFKFESLRRKDNFEPDAQKYQELLMRANLDGARDFNLKVSEAMVETDSLAAMVMGEKPSRFYFRFGAKVLDALAERLVLAEAGYLLDEGINPMDHLDAVFFPSGMGAIYTLTEFMAESIDDLDRARLRVKLADEGVDERPLFVQGNVVYVNTNNVLGERMRNKVIAPSIKVDTTDLMKVGKVLKQLGDRCFGLYFEPLTNPDIRYTNTKSMALLGSSYQIPVIVDNTFLTPYLQQPFRMGADVVIHSLTKYGNGFGDMLAGAIIGPKALISAIKLWQYDSGNVTQSPDSAIKLYDRISDMPSRMDTQAGNAKAIANYLKGSEYVDKVHYPDLEDETRGGLAGAVISFILAGQTLEERTAKERALMQYNIDHPGVINHEVSLGDNVNLMIGENTLGFPNVDSNAGFVRFAVGRTPDAEKTIKFLEKALTEVYK